MRNIGNMAESLLSMWCAEAGPKIANALNSISNSSCASSANCSSFAAMTLKKRWPLRRSTRLKYC